MKSIYVLTQRTMNGTVTIGTDVAAFTTPELALKAKEATITAQEKSNKTNLIPLGVFFDDIKEIPIYETEQEVPILKELNEDAEYE